MSQAQAVSKISKKKSRELDFALANNRSAYVNTLVSDDDLDSLDGCSASNTKQATADAVGPSETDGEHEGGPVARSSKLKI